MKDLLQEQARETKPITIVHWFPGDNTSHGRCLDPPRRDGEDIEEADPKDGCRALHAAVITEQEDAVTYLLRTLGCPKISAESSWTWSNRLSQVIICDNHLGKRSCGLSQVITEFLQDSQKESMDHHSFRFP